MLLALRQLLLRGGVTVGICAIAALSTSGFLSLIATNLQPKKQAVSETTPNVTCTPSHCAPKTRGVRLSPQDHGRWTGTLSPNVGRQNSNLDLARR